MVSDPRQETPFLKSVSQKSPRLLHLLTPLLAPVSLVSCRLSTSMAKASPMLVYCSASWADRDIWYAFCDTVRAPTTTRASGDCNRNRRKRGTGLGGWHGLLASILM